MIRTIGAIFCHVRRTSLVFHDKPSITSGNQKWNGAAPVLVRSAEFIIIDSVSSVQKVRDSFVDRREIILNMKIKDASVWVRKYFAEASDEYMFLVDLMRGMMDSKLISKPIHILIQEYDEIAIRVPRIVELINRIL